MFIIIVIIIVPLLHNNRVLRIQARLFLQKLLSRMHVEGKIVSLVRLLINVNIGFQLAL